MKEMKTNRITLYTLMTIGLTLLWTSCNGIKNTNAPFAHKHYIALCNDEGKPLAENESPDWQVTARLVRCTTDEKFGNGGVRVDLERVSGKEGIAYALSISDGHFIYPPNYDKINRLPAVIYEVEVTLRRSGYESRKYLLTIRYDEPRRIRSIQPRYFVDGIETTDKIDDTPLFRLHVAEKNE